MISNVAPSGFANPSGGMALNTSQSESLLALLTNYDPKNLTQSDAIDIVSGIREIGITGARGLGDLLNQTGFQPRELAEKSGVMRGDPIPPATIVHFDDAAASYGETKPQTIDQSNHDALASLTRLVEKYDGNNLSDDDWTRLYKELETEGIDVSKPLLDILL